MGDELTIQLQLSERQWARVAPLIAGADPAALAAGRALVAALLEQALLGTSWATLTATDPRWADV